MGPAQAGGSKTQKKRSAVKRPADYQNVVHGFTNTKKRSAVKCAPCGKQTFLFEVPRTQFLL